MDIALIGILIVGLVATLVINYSLSKENKSLKNLQELKEASEYDHQHRIVIKNMKLSAEISRLKEDRVTNTVYAYVAFCQKQYFVGLITKAANEREAYGYAHEIIKNHFGTDEMTLSVITLWIPGINATIPEEIKDEQ